MKFAKNHRPHGGLSNLYVFKKYVNNVPTGEEYYGMNVMTDYGFEQCFNLKKSFPSNFYVGQGLDESVNFKTTQTLIQPSYDKAASVISFCVNPATGYDDHFKYPMWYDNDSGLISIMCRYMNCQFKDQFGGGPYVDISITEYGIGTAINELWTHSWLYDLQGDRITNFTKYANERLDIEVYFVMTYDKTLITNGWANDRHVAITTLDSFIKARFGYSSDGNAYAYKRGNTLGALTSDKIISMGQSSNANIYTTISEYEVYTSTSATDGYTSGFIQKFDGFICVEPQLMSQNENVDILIKANGDQLKSETNKSAFAHVRSTTISDKFGYPDEADYPFSVFDVSHAYLFNKSNATYSNEVPFVNSSTHDYNETTFGSACSVPIYYTNTSTGHIIEAFLHVNPKTTDLITKFNNFNTTIYATDEYWKRSTWQVISDVSNVPSSLGNKHFYISLTNVTLNPTRASSLFTLQGVDGDAYNLDFNYTSYGQHRTCENYTCGCFSIDANIFFLSKNYKYTIAYQNDNVSSFEKADIYTFTFAENFITFTKGSSSGNPSSYYFTNLSEYIAGIGNISTNKYSLIDANNGFTNNAYVYDPITDLYKTETTSGVIGLQSTNSNLKEFVVMYVEHELDNPSAGIIGHLNRRFRFNSEIGCCVRSSTTNRIAYFYNNVIYTKQYDITNNAWNKLKDFALPSGYATPILMFGLNDKVWVVGPTYTVVYDMITDTEGSSGTPCENIVSINNAISNSYCVNQTSVDDCIVIYPDINKSGVQNAIFGNAYYIDYNHPTLPYKLPYVETSTGNNADIQYMKLKYIRGNTLALIMGRTYTNGSAIGISIGIADFGKYLNKPIDAASGIDWISCQTTSDSAGTSGQSGIYCYGPYYIIMDYGLDINSEKKVFNIIPIEYQLTHRLTGTTKNITSLNHIKHISGKQWNIEVTNIKNINYGDSGKPPGSLN